MGSFLATGFGLTTTGTGLAVAGADAAVAADALADALGGPPADAVAEDDACAAWDASLSRSLRSAPTLAPLVAVLSWFSGWFSLFPSSVLGSWAATLPIMATPEGLCEILGSRTCETDS